MQIRVSICRQVVVDGKVDAFDIDATAEDVGCDANSLVELLEFLVAFDTDRDVSAGRDNEAGLPYRSS
jgi:hypothetical protein